MSLLLDTHVVLWWLAGAHLARDAVERIQDPNTRVLVSAATVWEAAIKRRLGKLRLAASLVDEIARSGFEPLPITGAHAEQEGALPPHHRDPFDRMLVAQAQAEALTLVTRDSAFEPYDVPLLQC